MDKVAALKIAFVDRITLLSFIRLLTLGGDFQIIWYFDPISPFAHRVLKIFKKMGFIRADVRRVENHIGQVRDIAGESEYAKSFREALNTCVKIKREILAQDPFLKKMGKIWDSNKIFLDFGKKIEPEVRTEFLRIAMVEWIIRTQLGVPLSHYVLMIKRTLWFPYIKSYAKSRGVRLVAYREPFSIKGVSEVVSKFSWFYGRVTPSLFKALQVRLRAAKAALHQQRTRDESKVAEQPNTPKIGVKFYVHLNFDFSRPSDFFWLNGSSLPYSKILLYDYYSDKELDPKTQSDLKEHGIKVIGVIGRGPGISPWISTSQILPVLFKNVAKIFLAAMLCLLRGKGVSLYFLERLLNLAVWYAYWYDFYAFNNVRVDIAPSFSTSVGQVLALDALDAVSFAYQYSLFFIVPSPQNSSGEDVQFVYSRLSEELLWRSFGAPVRRYVRIGCVHSNGVMDEGFSNIIEKTRKKLKDNGVRFILCYLDEGSMNRWNYPLQDEDSASDYEYLLKWLLSDPTLGIVVKPKKQKTLQQRIAMISTLFDQARQTGRLIILGSEDFGSAIYPSVAALVGDVCIGHLVGASAAFEARLAGVPTVLIDALGLTNHPFYKWGRSGVIFDNWESLRTAVEKYKVEPKAHPEFGDWSSGVKELDPFQDGQAGLRMGLYIQWVYEALKQGVPKEEALKTATKSFEQQWGKGHVTFGNGD